MAALEQNQFSAKAWTLMKEVRVAMMTTSHNDELHSRPMILRVCIVGVNMKAGSDLHTGHSAGVGLLWWSAAQSEKWTGNPSHPFALLLQQLLGCCKA